MVHVKCTVMNFWGSSRIPWIWVGNLVFHEFQLTDPTSMGTDASSLVTRWKVVRYMSRRKQTVLITPLISQLSSWHITLLPVRREPQSSRYSCIILAIPPYSCTPTFWKCHPLSANKFIFIRNSVTKHSVAVVVAITLRDSEKDITLF